MVSREIWIKQALLTSNSIHRAILMLFEKLTHSCFIHNSNNIHEQIMQSRAYKWRLEIKKIREFKK
jgi:hypothetical protein